MKTIMIATDFSDNATHAAHYSYALAQQLTADIVLCNAMSIQAEIPQAGFVVWPTNQYDTLMDDSGKDLDNLKKDLYRLTMGSSHKPHITCVTQPGTVTDVIDKVADEYKVEMVVTGTHVNSAITEFVIGDHTKNLIDKASRMLLTIPPTSAFKLVERVALALDLNDVQQDAAAVLQVADFAKQLGAELLLTHIHVGGYLDNTVQESLYSKLNSLAQKTNYKKIDTVLIKAEKVEPGLDWLCKNNNIQILAMSHHRHGLFESIFQGSHTKRIINHMRIPLLVLPVEQPNKN